MNYRQDHIRLLKVFARELPKRPSMKVADLAKAAFSDIKKRKPDCESLSPDRACRNALRKPREDGHIEIAERGEYRLTQQGAAFCKLLDKYDVAPDKGVEGSSTKKVTGKKTEKKVAAKKSEPKATAVKKEEKKVVQPAKVEKKVAAPENKEPAIKKPLLPPPSKPAKPTAAEQADAAAKTAAVEEPVDSIVDEDPDEIGGGDPEPMEDLAAQLGL